MRFSADRRRPWWVFGIVYAVIFGAGMGGQVLLREHNALSAIVTGVISGAIFGVFMGKWTEKQRGQLRDTFGVPDRLVREASRAVRGKDIPADPEVRTAAAKLARYRLTELERQQKWSPYFFLIMILVSGGLAFSSSRLWWLATALFVGLLAYTRHSLRRLPHRVEQLESAVL
jgi:hypothetical protein